MAYVIQNAALAGAQPIAVADTTQRHTLGTVVSAVDPTYGAGEFIYLQGAATTAVGSWVTYYEDDWTTALLAADAVGRVAVAMSANVASSYGWYQIKGKAVGKALTGYADNAAVYATATAGSVDDAVVAGDLVMNALGASAVGTPSTGLAEFEIDRPYTLDGKVTNDYMVSLDIADGSAEAVYYLVCPHAGTISKIWTVIDGAVSTADITITAAVGVTAVTNGVVTIATASSAAGDIDSATPTAANTVTAGQAVNFTVTGGGAGGSPRIHLVMVVSR